VGLCARIARRSPDVCAVVRSKPCFQAVPPSRASKPCLQAVPPSRASKPCAPSRASKPCLQAVCSKPCNPSRVIQAMCSKPRACSQPLAVCSLSKLRIAWIGCQVTVLPGGLRRDADRTADRVCRPIPRVSPPRGDSSWCAAWCAAAAVPPMPCCSLSSSPVCCSPRCVCARERERD